MCSCLGSKTESSVPNCKNAARKSTLAMAMEIKRAFLFLFISIGYVVGQAIFDVRLFKSVK
jgi:hypothetical protein